MAEHARCGWKQPRCAETSERHRFSSIGYSAATWPGCLRCAPGLHGGRDPVQRFGAAGPTGAHQDAALQWPVRFTGRGGATPIDISCPLRAACRTSGPDMFARVDWLVICGGGSMRPVVKNNLAMTPKSLVYRLVGVNKDGVEAVRVEWVGEDERTAADLLRGAPENLGEMSLRVRDLVNSRVETTSADVARELGITPKAANQYLNRRCAGAYVSHTRRGVYAPATSSADHTEDSEGTEDFLRANGMRNLVSWCAAGTGTADVRGPRNPHHLQDLQALSTSDDGDPAPAW